MSDHGTAFESYARLQRFSYHHAKLGLSVDLSGMQIEQGDLDRLKPSVQAAISAMAELEQGVIANPDEGRKVGHYWLRAAERAPDTELASEIARAQEAVMDFATDVHAGRISPPSAERFERAVVVGIGGSSLGPRLVYEALRGDLPSMRLDFIDNTDPDGIDRLLVELGDSISDTLVIVTSKSGSTVETRNGLLEMDAAYRRRGLAFSAHAVAITQPGSRLEQQAQAQGYLACFPIWDWVGGRTSVTSAVGILPLALAGGDVAAFLRGAATMDEATRAESLADNPAALLAAAWHVCGGGQGARAMVVIPYKDRLGLLAGYLQQLVMESLGKREALDGTVVHQGLTVFGNKGSTDQHAYVQQLLDGMDDFFVTFVEVLRDRRTTEERTEIEPGLNTGDYLSGFLHGTRQALSERGRQSLLLTVEELEAEQLGGLVALFERAVGLYGSMIGVNPYHQPAVEAGKRAAGEHLALLRRVHEHLCQEASGPLTAEQIAVALGDVSPDAVLAVAQHLSANPRFRIERHCEPDEAWYLARFGVRG